MSHSHKRGSFPPSGTKTYRSRESAYDSGIGSLSSDHASLGGRSDRIFTAQGYDYDHHHWDPHAVEEARKRASEKAEHYKAKCYELNEQLSKSHKALRESEARWKAQCDRNEQLEQDLNIFKEKNAKIKASYDDLATKYEGLREQLDLNNPIDNPMMSGAGSLPIRTKSKHDHDDKKLKERLKARSSPKEESKSSHRRDRSKGPSTRQGAYVEQMPTRSHSNYRTSSESRRLSMVAPPSPYSSIPRTAQSTTSSMYVHANSEFPDGNYQAFPLPAEPRGRR